MAKRTASLLLLLSLSLLLCKQQAVHAAIASASVLPASLDAGVVSDVTVSFTAGADVEVGGSVLVELSAGFRIPSTTTVAVLTAGSTTLTVATVSTTQLSVDVGTTKISADAAFEFAFADVANPAAQTTSDFTITTYNSSATLLEISTEVSGVTIKRTTLAGASVVPNSLDAGAATSATVAFTSAVGLPVGSLVKVTFPNDFAVASTTLLSASGITNSSTVTTDSSVVTVEIADSAVAAGSSVTFVLDGVTNPGAKTTGMFAVATMESSGTYTFQDDTAVSGVATLKTVLADASVVPVSSIAGAATSATVAFTSAVGLPVGSLVKVTFPNDFAVASTTLLSASGITNSSTVTTDSSVVTVEIADSAVAAGSSVTFVLDGVTNPGAKTTGMLAVATMESSGTYTFQDDTAVSGVATLKTVLADASVVPVSSIAGAATSATVAFTSAVGLPVGSLVKVTFPNDFAVASTTLLSASGITNSSTVTTDSSVVTVEIADSAVTAGSSVTFVLDGVTNPGAKTTGMFAVATMESSSTYTFQDDTAVSGVATLKTVLADASVVPVSPIAGAATSATVAFTSAVGLPVGSLVKVTFPNDFAVASTTLLSASGITNSSTVTTDSSVVTVEIADSAVTAGSSVTFVLDGVTNLGAKTTGMFAVATMESSGTYTFQDDTAVSGVATLKTVLADASVVPVSSIAGAATSATVAFTSAVGLPVGSLVKVTFPNDFAVASTTLLSASGITNSSTVTTDSSVVTVEIADSAVTAGSSVTFVLDGVTNPGAKTTGMFAVATMESSSTYTFQDDTAVSGVATLKTVLADASVVPVSPIAGAATSATVAFTSAVGLPVGSLVKVTFPNDFAVASTTLLSASGITNSSTVTTDSSVVTVEIADSAVTAGSSVTFVLDGVTNLGAKTTGMFAVATMESSSTYTFQDDTAVSGVATLKTVLADASVVPVSPIAGAATSATVAFTSAVGLPVGSLVKVTFPNDFAVASTTLLSASGITNSSTVTTDSSVVTVEIADSAVTAGSSVTFVLDGVTNLGAKTTGMFAVATMESSGTYTFQDDTAVSGVATLKTVLADASVVPVSSIAGAATSATVAFTSAVGLPVGSLVKVTFPNDFAVASTTLLSASGITNSSTVTTDSSVVTVEIADSAVTAGSSVTFVLDGVTNPGAKTTGMFAVATMESSGTYTFQDDTAVSGVATLKTVLADASVVPVSSIAGAATSATVAFTSAVGLPVGSLVKVTFPNDFAVASTTLLSASGITNSSTVTTDSSVVTVEIADSAVTAGSSVTFVLDGVTNPGAKTTGMFAVATMESSGTYTFQDDTAVSGVATLKTVLADASVVPVSSIAGAATSATVAFTSAVGLPVGSLVKVTFPNDFAVASTTLLSASGITNSSTVTTDSSVVTVEIADSAVAAGSSVTFVLDGVTNPGAKTTGMFAVATMESSGTYTFQDDTAVSGVATLKTVLADASVVPVSSIAGAATSATVAFTSAVGLPVGSLVKVTFPNDFAVASTTLLSASGITNSSTVTTDSSVVTVEIADSAVTAGSSVTFVLDGVTNLGAKTTGMFAVATMESSGTYTFQDDTAVSGVATLKTVLADASVVPVSSIAGAATSATVAFTSAVGLPVGSLVKVTFPNDFAVASTTLLSASGITNSSTVTTDSSVVTVEIADSAVAAGSSVTFVLDGVTNPGAKTTGMFAVATMESSGTSIFQDAEDIWPVVITSTSLVGVSVAVDNAIAGVESSYTVDFTMDVDVPVGGYVVVAVPSDYTLSEAPTFVDSVLSMTWAGSINGESVKFQSLTSYAAGQHSVQVKFLQNPGNVFLLNGMHVTFLTSSWFCSELGASTTGSFTVSTTDADEFLLQTASCSGVEIVPGSITDAVLTPQLAHPGIVSRVDISFTASAGLATDSLLAIYLPVGEYDAAVVVIFAVVSSPLGVSASASWNSSNSAILVLLTSSTTIQHGAAVTFEVTALDMPPSVRASSTAATIQSWNDKGLQLDDASTLTLSAVTAVQDLPCSWATETPNPGITSNVLVTFKTNGMIPVGGKLALALPASDFYSDSVGNTPSVVFQVPSTVLGAASWDDTSNTLEVVISNNSIPAYKAGVQLKVTKLDTPVSVRSASRLPASLTTFDPLGIVIDGPSMLQLDAITAGYVSGSRLWTAVNAVAGVTSDQTVDFSITGRMDPGGKFELTLPDSQWSMAAASSGTFISPNLGDAGSVVWDAPTRMMTVTLTGATAIPAYSGVVFIIRDVTNPPKETGINNAYLTTRAADNSIIDGPDTISVMTISRGTLTGTKTWTSVTTASATMQSDQLLSFTLGGALPSGSIILVTLPAGGWRFVNGASVDVSFSLPASGVTVQSATWSSEVAELRIVTSGSLSESTPVELLIKDMINPYQSSPTGACRVLTMLADSGVVDESKDIVLNPITSEALPTEGSWASSLATPGVLSTQTVTFTTGGKLEPGARFCIATVDVWTVMASTSAALTLAGSTQSSPLVLSFDKTTGTLCTHTDLGIDQETGVSIVLTDILSPESVHPERVVSLRIQSHLGGDVNTGSVRINAITAGALTAPLTWQTLIFIPGPVAGLRTSANLALKTTGQIAAGGYIKVKLPVEWVMASTCEATFVHPSVRGTPSCSQNDISILLLDGLSADADVDILFAGVYNPPVVMPGGVASAWTIAADGGMVDSSDSITTGAIVSAVTGINNSGDHLVAVVGVSKTFSFEGSALAQGDVIKFVDASTTSDANCGTATTGESDAGGVSVKSLSANDDVTVKFTQSSPDGQPFAICYKFGTNPFKLYPALSLTVKQIKVVTSDEGSADIAVAKLVKTWRFTGNGIASGDQVRWIDLQVVESAAFISVPPDCLDTSALATLTSPVGGTLTAPEDDYTRVVSAADAAFAFSVDSSGKTYCLCYKFGSEPYKVYASIKVQVKHLRSIEAASVGSDSVAVVDAAKSFKFFGDGVFLNDRLYFVEAGSVSSCAESNNDTSLQLTHWINDQVQSTVFLNGDLVAGVNFEAAAAGKVVVPCYQFGTEPHQLYPEIWLTVKMVTHYTGTLGSPQLAVAEVAEPLTFLGYGLSGGDQVRWILNGEEDCESSLTWMTEARTLALVDTITLDDETSATFVFTSTQSDYNPVLCYKFGLENFMLYPDISIGIGTIRDKSTLTGAKEVAVAGARKNFTLVGTNLAQGDRVGWTSVLNSTVPCTNLSLLVPNPRNMDNDYLSYVATNGQTTFGVALAPLNSGKRVYLCYGFGREPFKLFPELYLNVKSVTNLRALVASPHVAVAGAMKTFLFDGDGVTTGDFAKLVPGDRSDCTAPGIALMNIMKEFDDYEEMAMFLYEIGDRTTTGTFQVSADDSSAGVDRVICYRFGVESFTYYENFHVDVKTIWKLHQVDQSSGGQDDVLVVNEPKHMTIVGVGMSEKDTLKFVNAADDSGDADCVDLPAEGQTEPRLQVNEDASVWLPFDSGSDGGTWTLCYKFDDEPYRLYPAVVVVVKEVTALLDYTFQDIDGLGAVATIGHRKQWKVEGSGIQDGDTVKIVPQSVTASIDCGEGDANLVTGTAVMTVGPKLMFAGILAAYPASISDAYHVCYKFQDEPFTYVRGFTLTTYGLTNLDRDVVLVSATTTAQISGFRISDTDEMGWTTSATSCSAMIGRTEVAGLKAAISFTDSYTRLYLCYSFDRQPFDMFKSVTLAVAKAEIWTPRTVSIIADQPTALDVLGTFGITQGADQIAWVPSDVVECSTEAVALYAGVMPTSISSVERSQSSVPHAGKATFNAKYVAPSTGSGVTATDSFSTWKLCYRFATTPNYLMFGDVLCSVLNIVQVSLLSLDATSTGAVMKFAFDGVGMQDFDAVKWVDAAAASSDADCNALRAIGGSEPSDVVNSRATFTFVEESPAMALCYKFLGHAFKLYANIPIQDSTKTGASVGQNTAGTVTSSYDEEAIAAASDQFIARRDIATISLTLDKDINEIPAGSNAESAFKAAFITTVATSLGIDASRIQITDLVAGSVVVHFQLLASDNPADPSVSEAVQDLHAQLLDASSNLLASNTVVVKNAATALSVTLATLPAPAASSVAIQALGYQSNGLFSFVRSIYSVTEKSSKLVIPILRQQGTGSVVLITVQVETSGTTAVLDDDYSFPASTTFDASLKLIHLSFEIGQVVQILELNLLDNDVKGVHFKTLALAMLRPQINGATLGSTKETTVRIYDYDDGVSLAKTTFAVNNEDSDGQRDLLQGWQVVANGESPLRVDGNGLFAVDDVLGEAEYNERCDLAAPTGVCTYACELGGGLPSFNGVETTYNVLSLDGDDYVASMTGVSAFPSEAFTVSLWVKTTQSDPGACLYSYAASSLTDPAVPLALCNPSNLQLFLNAESDVNGLATFVNVSDNAWHFLAITWNSADGRVRVFDNGMLAFDGGPYRGGTTIESSGVFVLGHLVLSSAATAPCTVMSSTSSSDDAGQFSTEDVSCNVVANSGFKGQVQHVHVWSRMLGRSELLGELAWPLRVVSNGLVLGWNFDAAFLLLQGRVVNDLSMQGQEQKNFGYVHCSAPNSTVSSSCLLRGEMPRLDAAFPCGPVFSNVWYFSAPSTFTAKLKSAYGGRLQFRLLAPSFNGSPRPRRRQVTIFGTDVDGMPTQVSVALGSFDLPSASRWTFYSVVLREDFGWITEPHGASLAAAEFKAVLHGATALWIRGDIWGYDSTGSGQEVVYLNDVALFTR